MLRKQSEEIKIGIKRNNRRCIELSESSGDEEQQHDRRMIGHLNQKKQTFHS